ncbi:MAG: SDR family oxidoreductase [Planctomycetes bacterium]|nr:SDR family oxidoreductase [Planctomycetota bacterium]
MAERRAAIVTGAGSGVGRAAAVHLAGAGYDVALVARRRETLEETAGLVCDASGGKIKTLVITADVSESTACQSVVKQSLAVFGRIDALVNAAGYAQICPIEKITPQEWRKTIDTNLSYVMYLTSAAWEAFRGQKSGVIVNVSSLASLDPFPGFALYAPAKAALNMFTLITGREGAAIGVRAVCIAPGAIETPMLRGLFSEKMLPRHKTLDPDDVAALITDCITGKRAFAPGETIPLPSP